MIIEPSEKPPFDAYVGNEPFLFVSYAHLDKKLVYPIIGELFKKGFRIWYDEGIRATREWPEEIGESLKSCNCFLVFITPRALESVNVRNEIYLATTKKKRVCVVYLEDAKLPSGIELQISSIHALFKHKMPDETFWKKLTNELSDVICKPIAETSKIPIESPNVETVEKTAGLQQGKKAENEEKRILRQILQNKIHGSLEELSNEMKVPPEILIKYLEQIAITHKDSNQYWIKLEEFQESSNHSKISQVLYYQDEILKEIENYIKRITNKEVKFRVVENIIHDTQMGFTIQDDQITGIGLYDCGISTLPEALGFLKSLRVLGIGKNKLTSFPKSFKQLKLLEVLILDNNRFEKLPSLVKNFAMLQELYLKSNKLYYLPDSIKHLNNLQSLDIDNNKIKVIVSESIENLELLKDLRLSNNQLTNLPESIGRLKSLEVLKVNNNPLVNLPLTMRNLKSLKFLYLKGTKLGGIPNHLLALKQTGQLSIYK